MPSAPPGRRRPRRRCCHPARRARLRWIYQRSPMRPPALRGTPAWCPCRHRRQRAITPARWRESFPARANPVSSIGLERFMPRRDPARRLASNLINAWHRIRIRRIARHDCRDRDAAAGEGGRPCGGVRLGTAQAARAPRPRERSIAAARTGRRPSLERPGRDGRDRQVEANDRCNAGRDPQVHRPGQVVVARRARSPDRNKGARDDGARGRPLTSYAWRRSATCDSAQTRQVGRRTLPGPT